MYVKRFNENNSMDNLVGYIKVIIIENCEIYLKIYSYDEHNYSNYDDYDEFDLKLSEGDIIYIDVLDDMGHEVFVSIELKQFDHAGTGLLNKEYFEVDIEKYLDWKNSKMGGNYLDYRNNIDKYNV